MASENFERRIEFIHAQQAQSAAKIKEIEDIIVSLARQTRDRVKATEPVNSHVPKKVIAKKTDEALASLIADMERVFNHGRNRKSNDKY